MNTIRARRAHFAPKSVVACLLAGVLAALALGLTIIQDAASDEIVTTDPVLVGAGDIASCTEDGDEKTAALLDSIPGTVFTAGDNAYEAGTAAEYQNCYGPTWGRHKARTHPVPGNHEYGSPGAAPYYDYFGSNAGLAGQGYYSYDLGAWHVIALNSNVAAGIGSAQYEWLREDLAANPTACTAAYWHHPVFSSGMHGNDPRMAEAWKLLDEAGADVVLAGHDHDYERFAPQTFGGRADPNGIRQFVVGTGGRHLRAFSTVRPNSVVRNSDTLGVLKLTLHPAGYDWEFVPEVGKTFRDSGSAACASADNTAPLIMQPRPRPRSTVRDRTPTISATVRDAQTGLTKANMNLYLDGRRKTFSYNEATDKLAYTPRRKLTPGSHSVKVIARDAQGLSKSRTWNFRVAR